MDVSKSLVSQSMDLSVATTRSWIEVCPDSEGSKGRDV